LTLRAKLEAFKERIRSDRMPALFTGTTLGAKVLAAWHDRPGEFGFLDTFLQSGISSIPDCQNPFAFSLPGFGFQRGREPDCRPDVPGI